MLEENIEMVRRAVEVSRLLGNEAFKRGDFSGDHTSSNRDTVVDRRSLPQPLNSLPLTKRSCSEGIRQSNIRRRCGCHPFQEPFGSILRVGLPCRGASGCQTSVSSRSKVVERAVQV